MLQWKSLSLADFIDIIPLKMSFQRFPFWSKNMLIIRDQKYCLACASGGYAMSVALRATGLQPGESVLTNTFTLAPVPGSISNAGGKPIFIEITKDLVLDLDDLSKKANSSGARFLLISHMRGHLVDMDQLMKIVNENNLILIEDCAHTMGAQWGKQKSGNFGLAGCFSTQTYKHLNSGEGGLLTSNDEEFMARAIIYSGVLYAL